MKKYIIHIANLLIFLLFLAGYRLGIDLAIYMIPLQTALVIANVVFAKNKRQIIALNFLLAVASVGGLGLSMLLYKAGISMIKWENIMGDDFIIIYMHIIPVVMLIITVVGIIVKSVCRNRIVKRIVLSIALIAELCTVVCWGGREGWRMFGFYLCENPGYYYVEELKVNSDTARICGGTSSSALCYSGYIHKIEDNTLYLGLKYSLFFYPEGSTGSYDIELYEDMTNIERIVLTDGIRENDRCIWERDKDKFYPEKIKAIRLYDNTYVKKRENYKKILKNREYYYADNKLLEMVHNAENEMVFVKGYKNQTAIAELDDGTEVLLKFADNQNIFWIDDGDEIAGNNIYVME